MIDRERYAPGAAGGAHIKKERLQNGQEKWTLVLVRELRHPPERVWQALTDPAHLREWAPFDAGGNLGTVGTVKLTWMRNSIRGDRRPDESPPGEDAAREHHHHSKVLRACQQEAHGEAAEAFGRVIQESE